MTTYVPSARVTQSAAYKLLIRNLALGTTVSVILMPSLGSGVRQIWVGIPALPPPSHVILSLSLFRASVSSSVKRENNVYLFLMFIFLSKLYTQCGAQTHGLEIRSRTLL